MKRRSTRLANAKRVLTDKSQDQGSAFSAHHLDESNVVSGSTLNNPNPNMSTLMSYNDFTVSSHTLHLFHIFIFINFFIFNHLLISSNFY